MSIISNFFRTGATKVLVDKSLYGDSRLGQDLRRLTTKSETADVTILEGGLERKEYRIDESTILRQISVGKESYFYPSGDPSSLLMLALGVPRITMKLPNGKGVVPVGGGSCARIGKGIFLGANHVNSMGVGDIKNPLSGRDVLKKIEELTNQGAEIWIDFPIPASPKTIFSGQLPETEKKSGIEAVSFDKRSGIRIVSARAVILGEDVKNDLAILGLENPKADIVLPGVPQGNIPLVRLGAEYPEAGNLGIKVGHAGCSDETLITVGEVLIPELTREKVDEIIAQIEKLKGSVGNVLGDLKKDNSLNPRAILMSLAQDPREQLKHFQGKVITNGLAEPGDSGGILIDPNTGEIRGTTVLTLNPILNNRIAAGIISGYLLGVQPSHIPVDHLSAYTGIKPILELLDQTVGRKNLYRILDGKGEEVVVTKQEAHLNSTKHTAVFAVREAVKAELEHEGKGELTPDLIDSEIKSRHNFEVESPIDLNDLAQKVKAGRPQNLDSSELSVVEQPDNSIECKIGGHSFANKPISVTDLDIKLCESDINSIDLRIEFKTEGPDETVYVTLNPKDLLDESSSNILDNHTRDLIVNYLDDNPVKADKVLITVKKILQEIPES